MCLMVYGISCLENAVFGIGMHCNAFNNRSLLCKMTLISESCKIKQTELYITVTGNRPFFPAFFNSEGAGFLCSPEHGKLCFEHLEKNSAAQNNLPLQGAEKDLRSRLFV